MSKLDDRWNKNKAVLVAAARYAEIDPGIMAKISGFESGYRDDNRPISRNEWMNKVRQFDGVMAISSGYGYGQFLDGTWKEMINTYGEKYGISDASVMTKARTNAVELRGNSAIQAAMLAEFTRENIEKGAKLGGPDADANVYAFHNLGGGDATRFLKALRDNPSQRADEILSTAVIAGNPSLYGDGSRSISASYRVMGQLMSSYDKYAIEARELSNPEKLNFSNGVPASFHTSPSLRQPSPYHAMSDGLLRQGDHGPEVRVLQEKLNALGMTDASGRVLSPDGDYGKSTHEAVEAFQRRHGLHVDGVAGDKTLVALQAFTRVPNPVEEFRESLQRHGIAPAVTPDTGITNGLPDYMRVHPPHARSPANPPAAATRHAPRSHDALADGLLRQGERGPAVAALQENLRFLGATNSKGGPLEPDSIYGTDTKDGVERFQLWTGYGPGGR